MKVKKTCISSILNTFVDTDVNHESNLYNDLERAVAHSLQLRARQST